jgi:hypothetical protein
MSTATRSALAVFVIAWLTTPLLAANGRYYPTTRPTMALLTQCRADLDAIIARQKSLADQTAKPLDRPSDASGLRDRQAALVEQAVDLRKRLFEMIGRADRPMRDALDEMRFAAGAMDRGEVESAAENQRGALGHLALAGQAIDQALIWLRAATQPSSRPAAG